MSSLRQDLRFALRALRKRPGFALVVVATLAVALGANTTMMALVDAVLLRPLPFAEPDRLVALWDSRPEQGEERWRVSSADFLSWREQSTAFERLALYAYDERTMTGEGDPVQLFGSRVSEDFFPLLGVEPLLGRTLSTADFTADAEPAVVVSHAFWRQRLGGDADAVGRTVTLDSVKYTVVGVLPRQLMPLVAWHSGRLEFGSSRERYWIPYANLRPQQGHTNGVLGKLAPGVGLEQARVRMETIARRLEEESPTTNKGFRVEVKPLRDEAVGDVRSSLWLVLGAVGLLLAVACGNVANLLLARGVERGKELAVRAALGAGRLRIWRQVVTEGALLAAAGAVVGTALAAAGLRLLPYLVPREVPRLDEAVLDVRSLAATLGLCLLAGLLCSLLPAFQAGRARLEEALRSGGRRSGGRRSGGDGGARWSRRLVAVEMALAVTLVLGAALLVRSFLRLGAVDPGFERGEVLTVKLSHPSSRYTEMRQLNTFYEELFRQLAAVPGVTSVAAAYDEPLVSNWTQSFRALDEPKPPPGEGRVALFRTVTPGYFRTLGIEVVDGRGFTAADDASAAGVVLVNQAFVRRYSVERVPLGRKLAIDTLQWVWGDAIPTEFEIVGVVEDVRFAGLDTASEPAFYVPYRQAPQHGMSVLVRCGRDALSVLPELRAILRRLDPALPITNVSTMEEILASKMARPRWNALALGGFAAVALLLAMLGLWGVLSRAVGQRLHEIGIRMALGAGRRSVFVWTVWHGLAPALVGLVAGIAGALALGRLLRSLLFEVSASDPWTYAVVALMLVTVAALACALPARRASRTDPVVVLRDE